MESETLRNHIPPDWGSRPGTMVANEVWEEGAAGPSDYIRRAWAAGMRDRVRQWGTSKAVGDIWDGGFSGTTPQSAPPSRRTFTRSRRSSRASISSSGDDREDEERENIHAEEGIGDHPDRTPSSDAQPHRRRRRLPPPNRFTSLLPLALLPLLPTASAAPPIYTRPPPSKTPSAKPTSAPAARRTINAAASPHTRRNVQYPTSASMPAVLPTELATVDETLLPYIVSKGPDGYWTKINEGWRLYGRQSGESPVFAPDQPESTATSNFAVEEALPPGWGVQSTRTDFYRVPLIVVASVLIAVGIVVAIIIATLKRKKAHRRAKRRAERQRRKALAAAGLTEEGVNETQSQDQLREKLDDLQRQHRAKRKGETGVVSSSSARSRVRSWRAGILRKRKGKGGDGDAGGGDVAAAGIEEKPEDAAVDIPDRGSQDTDRSTPTVPSDEPASGSDGIGSRLNTVSSEETDSSGHANTPDRTDPTASSNPGLTVPGPSAATPYFPPAYRPASVRSFGGGGSGSSSSAQPTSSSSHPPPHPSPTLPSVEKVHAPGYYPAPATAEGEAALAVASRSEGKGRMPPSPGAEADGEEDREHMGHAATDDKLVMERMRMAASAPPAQGEEGEDGPSAPTVEVDQDGFERMTYAQPEDETSGPSSSISLGPPISRHPALPAPPPLRPHFGRSYSVEREVHEQLGELNLLPSAPPSLSRAPSRPSALATTSSAPHEPIEAAVPSAPPLLEEEEEAESAEAGPSAPPLPPGLAEEREEENEEGVAGGMRAGSDARGEAVAEESAPAGEAAGQEGDEEAQRRPSEAPSEPRVFLPKYEP